MYLWKSYWSILKCNKDHFAKMWSVSFFSVSLFWSPFYVALWLSHPVLFPVDSEGLAAIPLTTCLCFVYRIAFARPLFSLQRDNKFVTKSPVNSDEKGFKHKGNYHDTSKQNDAKKRKRNFQMSWLTEYAVNGQMFVTHRAHWSWEVTSLGRILFTPIQRAWIMLPVWWGMTVRTSPSRIRQLGKPWFVCKRSNIISWQVFFTLRTLSPKIVVHLGPGVVFYVRLGLLK